jgi:Bacterial PH domain
MRQDYRVNSDFVFRKPLFYTVAAIASGGCFSALVAAAVSKPNGSTFFGAVVLSAFIYFFWAIGWQSSVRVGNDGVIVDNLFTRHFIPWHDLSEVRGENGLLLVTRGGEKIGSLMYGGSIIGVLTGSRQSRAVASKIKSVQERAVSAGEPNDNDGNREYYSRTNFQPWPFVISLVVTELVAAFSYALR